MKKELLKYLILPLFYILSVILREFHFSMITNGIWLISIVLCVIGFIKLLTIKLNLKQKIIPILLMLIPLFDWSFGLNNNIRDQFKGEIVLHAVYNGFGKFESFLVREKNNELNAVKHFAIGEFELTENVNVKILNDSTVIFGYAEKLIFDRESQTLKALSDKRYQILKNKLLK